MTTALSFDTFKAWIGRSDCHDEVIAARPLAGLSACLDRNDPSPREGDAVPPGWHWLYFLPTYKTSEGGEDGHAKLGASLPPIPLPRRMWAGGRLSFYYPLRVGDRARRITTVKDVAVKTGRSGQLAFVTVEHEIFGAQGLAIVEEHDIVYRESNGAAGASPPAAPVKARFSRLIHPTPLLLFRYSALTYNGHRIHYDRGFCGEEGYPGLVVHGPLTATLLLDLVRDNCPNRRIASFQFRAVSPLFDTDDYTVNGKMVRDGADLWAASPMGALAMTAQARFA
ncbi:FAS1-like dehydratase domain-containing protein [Telmatospirillum siberiense]|uniref:Acyl-CoA dehydrogenase n=1 Tax=Telmatospirillum siberiense TaxID=382514 RepID=A0A2N3PMK8_9PROT|nr:MaoC family dehydratase N-terminal domain-containing protein [Telmatospirillum siberiense]PKU21630.1 acyl-CoA dehydrogenase [Telmatospirillum siberiense]